MVEVSFSSLHATVARFGFELHAIVRRDALEPVLAKASTKLKVWQEQGFAGEMSYMERPPELFSSLAQILPETRTIIVVVAPYPRRVPTAVERPPESGRVARYAWGRDYHRVLKKRLTSIVDAVEEESGRAIRARVFSDAVPLLERSMVSSTGLGFIGKNTLFIRPGDGSFSFIGEILWDVEVRDLPASSPSGPVPIVESTVPGSGCGTCARCLSACPTAAFPAPGVLDSRRCIAYLTIEKREPFTEWEAQAIGEWIFGCDICQEVCPFNHSHVPDTPLAELAPDRGVGPYLLLKTVLEIPDDDRFRDLFAGTALMRAGRARMIRNGCAVAANTVAVGLIPQLIGVVSGNRDRGLRREAATALARLREFTTGIERMRLERALASAEELFERSGAE